MKWVTIKDHVEVTHINMDNVVACRLHPLECAIMMRTCEGDGDMLSFHFKDNKTRDKVYQALLDIIQPIGLNDES